MRDEAEAMGALEHARRHLRRAAELARQRPLRSRAVAQNPAEDLRSRRGAGDLIDLGVAIDSEKPDAERIGAGDVLLLLIVLPKLTRSGVAPAASACSISLIEAASKQDPRSASRLRIPGAGFALTA